MALLIAALLVFGAVLGPPLTIYFTVRWEAEKLPWINVVPQPLTDYSVTRAPGTTLTYFGYSFEVPWNGSFKTKAGPKNSSTSGFVAVKFASGQDLLIIAPEDQNGLLSEIAHDQSMHLENLGLVFGDLTRSSAYDQYWALLNTTPSTVRAFGPRAEAVRGQILLMIKGIALPSSLETGAFSFQFPSKRGFQIGDPGNSRRIDLEVLDLDGHYVEIICTARQGIQLTQPEMNRILKSLEVARPHSVAVNAAAARTQRN